MPDPAPPLLVRQLRLGPMDNFVYLIGDPASHAAAVVDPAWDVPAILDAAAGAGLLLAALLITHAHHDHTNGLRALLEKTAARVHAGDADADALGLPHRLAARLDTGAGIRLGNRTIRALSTPGHTPGSRCYLAPGALFSGDTLFVGACGRCDFDDPGPRAMLDSLTRVLAPLPDDTVVYPGHDYDDIPSAPLAAVRRRNRALQIRDLEEFVSYVTGPRWPDEE